MFSVLISFLIPFIKEKPSIYLVLLTLYLDLWFLKGKGKEMNLDLLIIYLN